MKNTSIHKTILFLVVIMSQPYAFAEKYSASFQLGNALNAPQKIKIAANESGASYNNINFGAQLETRGFSTTPYYYSLKFGRWQDSQAWEIELLHQKLFLNEQDRPAKIQRFKITHGFNLIMLNHAR